MRRIADIRSARVNRAAHADFLGDVHLASSRPDKDSDGAGVSIGLAVVGVVAAGLGLMTMHTAFAPLPKPGVPVVISHAETRPAQAAWRHARDARPAVQTASASDADQISEPESSSRHADTSRPDVREPAAPDVAAKPAAVVATPALLSAKLSIQQIAKADVPGEKLCKAPTPQLLTVKALQPAMILRYDAKFKAPPLDIQPQRPAADDTERRLKLSALLSTILDN